MEKRVTFISVLLVLAVGLFYTGAFTGMVVNEETRYDQLKECVDDGGTSLLQCRLTLGTLTPAQFQAAADLPAGAAVTGLPSKEKLHQLIFDNWKNQKQKNIDFIHKKFADDKTRTLSLYKTQGRTNALLRYAEKKKDIQLLDELAEVYLVPWQYLEEVPTYYYKYLAKYVDYDRKPGTPHKLYGANEPLKKPIRIWKHDKTLNQDMMLDTGQFLFVISDAMAIFQELPPEQRTRNMRLFLDKYKPVLKEHYFRWGFEDEKIFKRKGNQCQRNEESNTNMYDHFQKLLDLRYQYRYGEQKSYCNGITDSELWIGSGIANLLRADAAARQNNEQPILTDDEQAKLQDYIDLFTRLLISRTTESQLTDFAGVQVTGYNFDLQNSLADNDEHTYAGYKGEVFPTEVDKRRVHQVGWDIGHGSRFVFVFSALNKAREATGQSWPTNEDLRKFANQFAYGAFNKNFERPLFTNFMDGTNGWYRVHYEEKQGFGIQPHGLTSAGLTGGWAFWYKYNQDIGRIMASLWKVVRSTDMFDNSGNNMLIIPGDNLKINVQGKIGPGVHNKDRKTPSLDCNTPKGLSSQQGSFEVWIKFDSIGKFEDILHIYESGGITDLYIAKNIDDTFWIVIEEGNTHKVNQVPAYKVEDTEWHHIVITQDGNGLKVYIDGSHVETDGKINTGSWTSHLDMDATHAGCLIGGAGGRTYNGFEGSLDEVRFYNRALSGEEVQQHFQGQFPENEQSLMAHWSFSYEDEELVEYKRKYYSGVIFKNHKRTDPIELFGLKDSESTLAFLASISDIVEE